MSGKGGIGSLKVPSAGPLAVPMPGGIGGAGAGWVKKGKAATLILPAPAARLCNASCRTGIYALRRSMRGGGDGNNGVDEAIEMIRPGPKGACTAAKS